MMMKYFAITIGLMFCLEKGTCQKNEKATLVNVEKILEISYNFGGGESGGSSTLRITKDSIIYSIGNYESQKVKSKKNKPINWNGLIHLINLKEFDSVPEGKDIRALDGTDTRIYVKTMAWTHSMIVDYEIIKQYPSVENLVTAIEKELKIISGHTPH